MSRRVVGVLVAAVLFVGALVAVSTGQVGAEPPPDPWVLTDLGTLGGSDSVASDINDNDQVVGNSYVAGGDFHAFLWEDGTMTDLGTLGGHNSSANAINDAGQVVGNSSIAGENHAFSWEDGTMTDLGTLGGHNSSAYGINEAGQIVGESQVVGGDYHAFSWEDGTMTDLGTLGGDDSQANDVNDAGQVVGTSEVPGGHSRAFLWEDGTMTDLGTLGGDDSYAYGINEAGQIVGSSLDSGGDLHAFVWEDGTMTDLGTLGGSISSAFEINDAGQVVGDSEDSDGTLHAFIWDDGTTTDLGTLGGDESSAFGINEAMTVVGLSEVNDAGDEHAAYWKYDAPFYVMVDEVGNVYAFPEDRHVGDADIAAGASAVDIVINPGGTGYYVLDDQGVIHAIGPDTFNQGNLNLDDLNDGEVPVAMSLTDTGDGYWIFTNLGKAVPFGDATDIGDVSDLPLVGEIVDAAPYPPGFYMAAADGGVFTPPAFLGSQQVPFFGSTYSQLGSIPLAKPIVTIYVDSTDGVGYSLAAGDGGMFNFDSEFCGSIPGVLPGVTLNQPVVNAVPYGDCYIFFAADGGAFVFGDKPFLGSLGADPPPDPIVSGDAHAT